MYLANAISRRSLIAGLGAGAVLLGGIARGIRAQSSTKRLRAAFFFHANGSHPDWTPTTDGPDFELSEILAPLEPVRDQLNILREITLQRGSGNPHAATSRSVLGAGAETSFDQLLGDHIETLQGADSPPLRSLLMTIGETEGGGGVIPGLSQRQGNFLPGHRNPVAAYMESIVPLVQAPNATMEREKEQLLSSRRSLIDYMRRDAVKFQQRLGAEERPKLEQYLDSMRDLENKLTLVIASQGESCGEAPPFPDLARNFRADVNDMPQVSRPFLDVMALALACGVTQVTSIMWGGGENNQRVNFEFAGNQIDMGSWHQSSHGDPQGADGRSMKWMQAYLADEYRYFIQKLQSYPDTEGASVLDNSICIWGTQCGISTQVAFAPEDHYRRNTPIILAGGLGGAFRTGRMIPCNDRNHNDVYSAVAQAFDPNWRDSVGEPDWNQGPLTELNS